MEWRREQASACPRASSRVPSLCHLLVCHLTHELYLALLPTPLLPFWLLSVFFYAIVLFFFPALPPLFFPLWFSKGRSAPAQPSKRNIVTKAQVGFFPAVNSLPLCLDSLISQ